MTTQPPPGAAQPGSADTADQAAPLDALLADAALGTFRRLTPDASTVKFAAALARRPHTTGRRLSSLAAELVRIGAGTSALAPARGDRRFADPAWTGNALLRRIVQSYLAAGQTAGQLIRDAGLSLCFNLQVSCCPPGVYARRFGRACLPVCCERLTCDDA